MSTDLRAVVLGALTDVAPEAEPGAIAPDVPLQQQLDLDSIGFLDFLTAISERTGVEVPEEDYDQVATLDGCVAYLEARSTGATTERRST